MVSKFLVLLIASVAFVNEQVSLVRLEQSYGKGVGIRHDSWPFHVRSINLSFQKQNDDADLSLLVNFVELEDLDFRMSNVSGAFLRDMKALKKLKSISFYNARQLDEEHFRFLVNLGGLEQLSLSDCPVTDQCLPFIVVLPHLKKLDLANTKVTGKGLTLLESIGTLEDLNLIGTRADETSIEAISKCPKMRSLWLGFSDKTNNRGLAKLKPLAKTLEELVLSNSLVTDEGLQELRVMTRLRCLHLNYLPVTDEGLKALEALTSLRALTLRRTKLTNSGLAVLSRLKNLETLELAQTKIDDEAIKYLMGITKLKRLDISRTGISDSGCEKLIERFPDLELLR